MFNGEFELLEIRLRTHSNAVDQFVLVEGNKTFRGKDKAYTILDLPKDLLDYKGRINVILFDVLTFKEIDGGWLACALQRDSMLRGLSDCNAEDIVIFSEIDEIMRPEKIVEAVKLLDSGLESVVFNQETFCYYLNVKDENTWDGPRMLKFNTILKKKLSPQIIVNDDYFDRKSSTRLDKSGWHFQNLGGVNRVIKKLQSSCHHELGSEKYSNFDIVSEKIKNLTEPLNRDEHKLHVVVIDDSFPKCIFKEQERYKDLIYEQKNIL